MLSKHMFILYTTSLTTHLIGGRKKREEPYNVKENSNYENNYLPNSAATTVNEWPFGHKIEKRNTGNISKRLKIM